TKWLEQAGVDALHVSTGSSFPHPRNPAGDFPVEDALTTFPSLIPSGRNELFNYLTLRALSTGRLYQMLWAKARGDKIEGINLSDTKAVKKAVNIPVICTGGFQTASVIEEAISGGSCDAVSIARPLVANNDLVKIFERGADRPEKPCTYCNKCLVNVLQNPLGCYEESRFDSREEMLAEIMSVFQPPPFG
ncbi:MAG: NADH:flavin oxidoreductase, partial [Acidobacteriales bacterium]